MKAFGFAAAVTLAAAVPVTAHNGVTDPVVMARMHGMKSLGMQLKTLGAMAKGERPFDAAAAQDALALLAEEAGRIPAQFRDKVTVPQSEARPAIWEDWDDFSARAEALRLAAAGLEIADADGLGPALRDLGGACKGCHSVHRE
ncbi:cytochrome c [Poseidonocella sp. HB161398]|uniref:c-type cytochrome n=1 Tax=Poseidonocella sp. HB161398 TaxID=2320855 RepID=UPI001485D17A|nr:cytochrome c [Poseidonocella sp. HB161398]